MGATYSKLLPNKPTSSKNPGYTDLLLDLMLEKNGEAEKDRLPAIADYALNCDHEEYQEDVAPKIVELPLQLAVTKQAISYSTVHLEQEWEAPEPVPEPVKLTKKQLKRQKDKAAKQEKK